nr:immunoglobulin light chain junction region [Macaca mulatta]MOW36967.1 immunoglobulin light chain junction region [Macaca mulatta]
DYYCQSADSSGNHF